MGLSSILLAIFLTLFALQAFGWVAVASWVLGIFALAAAIALLVEGLGGRTFTVGRP